MEDIHRNDVIHTRAEKNAKDLHEVVLLLERLVKNEYEDKVFDEHEKRWGELKTWFTPVEGRDDLSEWNSTRTNVKSLRDREIERKEFLAAAKHANYQEKQDVERVFLLIKTHYGKWWV